MKNVWILNHYAQEPAGAGGTRHFHLAEHLQGFGWQATIIAASVEHQSGRQRLAQGETQRCDHFNGLPFLWVRTPEYQGNGGGRARNMLTYTWRVLLNKTTRELPQPDVVIGSSVHPLAALAGALLASRFEVPFVFEVRDLWPQTLVEMGRLREGSVMTWGLRKLELWLYRRAARIVVLLPRAWEYIVPLGIPKERVVWIPNGVDLSMFPPTSLPQRALEEPFTLMYFGSHGLANGLSVVLQAMKIVQELQTTQPNGPNVCLRMIGDGPLKADLIAQAHALGLTNVYFESPVPKALIPSLASQADAFIIPIPDIPNLYRFGISPNKLFDYLAAKRPVIIATAIDHNSVAESGAGLTVKPDSPVDIANGIIKLSTLPYEVRKQMAEAGRNYVTTMHEYRGLAEKLASELSKLSNQLKENNETI